VLTILQQIESLDTEKLITMQVGQIEKEKKELSEKLRIISKRIDHIERAYRKEEKPLLAEDYKRQQELDKATFEAVQKSRREAAYNAHKEDMETKNRLARISADYRVYKEQVLQKKKAEFARKQELVAKKVAEDKKKRNDAVLKQREEEKRRREAEEAEALKKAREDREKADG